MNLTKAGLNNGGNKITNVAAGTDDTDAVNVSQLKQAATASKTEVVQGKNIVVTEKQVTKVRLFMKLLPIKTWTLTA